jgi:hypothetical protein
MEIRRTGEFNTWLKKLLITSKGAGHLRDPGRFAGLENAADWLYI